MYQWYIPISTKSSTLFCNTLITSSSANDSGVVVSYSDESKTSSEVNHGGKELDPWHCNTKNSVIPPVRTTSLLVEKVLYCGEEHFYDNIKTLKKRETLGSTSSVQEFKDVLDELDCLGEELQKGGRFQGFLGHLGAWASRSPRDNPERPGSSREQPRGPGEGPPVGIECF